jgi:exopolysaccharide production protein ExoZ
MLISVQFLRAFAALSVAFSHFPTESLPGPLIYLQGAIGVDLFFVISGYIIGMAAFSTKTEGQGPRASWRFFVRRLIRIYPTYILINLIVRGFDYRFHAALPDLPFLTSLSLYPLADSSGNLIYTYIPAAWTLSFEMFFYTCIAVLMWAGIVGFRSITALLGGIVVIGYFLPPPTNAALATMISSINLEFLMGLWILYAQRQLAPKTFQRWGYLALAIGLPLFFYVRTTTTSPSEGVYQGMNVEVARFILERWFGWGVPSALVFWGVLTLEAKLQWARRLTIVGDASFSLYLMHYFLFRLFSHYVPQTNSFYLVGLTLTVVMIPILFFKWVEHPMIEFLKSKL